MVQGGLLNPNRKTDFTALYILDSHHPNPTQMERVYRAFLFQEFPSVENDVFPFL